MVVYFNALSHLIKLRVALIIGIAEMFYLRHSKFKNANQSRTRRDLIAEGLPDLGSCERQFRLKF